MSKARLKKTSWMLAVGAMVFSLFVFGANVPVAAQWDAGHFIVEGKIALLDRQYSNHEAKELLVVKWSADITQTPTDRLLVIVDAATVISCGGREFSFSGLKEGDTVRVNYDEMRPDGLHAVKIEVLAGQPQASFSLSAE